MLESSFSREGEISSLPGEGYFAAACKWSRDAWIKVVKFRPSCDVRLARFDRPRLFKPCTSLCRWVEIVWPASKHATTFPSLVLLIHPPIQISSKHPPYVLTSKEIHLVNWTFTSFFLFFLFVFYSFFLFFLSLSVCFLAFRPFSVLEDGESSAIGMNVRK